MKLNYKSSHKKLIRLEGNSNLLEFLDSSSIGEYGLHHSFYDIPIDFIEGDIYRDKRINIFVESDSYLKSDFVNLSISKPRFIDLSGNTLYIGIKDFLGSLLRGEEFLFFELIASWDMRNNELFSHVYKYNEWLFSKQLVEVLFNRIEGRNLNSDDLSLNDVWNGIIDLIQLTILLNDTKKNTFKLSIGELELGEKKLKDYSGKKEEEELRTLLNSLMKGMDEYKKKFNSKVENGGFMTNEDRSAYLSKSMFYINELLQEYFYLDKFISCKFPLLKGSCELS